MEWLLKASSDTCVWLVNDFANDMIINATIPSDWENSFTINIYKGKGDALIRGNYRGLKVLDHVMKRIERVMGKIIRERVSTDDKQFGFVSEWGTADTISSSDKCWKNIWLRTGNCPLLLTTLRRHSIKYHENPHEKINQH